MYLTAETLRYHLANRQSESGALRKLIQFAKTIKNLLLFLLRDTDTSVFYIDMKAVAFRTEIVSNFYIARSRELDGIIDKIMDYDDYIYNEDIKALKAKMYNV